MTEHLLAGGGLSLDDPATFTGYFQSLYNTGDLDAKDIAGSRGKWDFPRTATSFRMIEDDTTTGVLVAWGEGADLARRVLAGEELARGDFRRLQPYLVSLYEKELARGLASGEVVLAEKLAVHVFRGRYDEALGVLLGGAPLAG